MKNKALRSPMPTAWRIVVYLAAAVGAVLGFLGAKALQPEGQFDLVLSLIFAFVAAGIFGGLAVVLWFIYRVLCPASENYEEDDSKG
jgi:zinc transporter ZupT